jgi:hypothetical protein
VRGLVGPKVKKIRYVAEEQWFLEEREPNVDHRFFTVWQESFYYAYINLGVQFSEHRLLHWGALRVAAGGVLILPYFERYPGLVPLLSERAQYVREWVRIFYATLFVGDERAYIQFMFNETQWRLDRGDIARLLGVTIPDEPSSLHFMSYGDAEPPRHAHDMDFPSDEDVSILFQQPFLLGTLRTLDRLTPVAYTINLALRRSLLYRQGYN